MVVVTRNIRRVMHVRSLRCDRLWTDGNISRGAMLQSIDMRDAVLLVVRA